MSSVAENKTTASVVTPEHKAAYEEKGFFVLERVIPPEHLQLLREEGQRLRDALDAEMERRGVSQIGLSFKDSRYFFSMWGKSDRIPEFMFSELMADICRSLLGPEAYLSFEQFVVKCDRGGMKFSWHQDSGYVPEGHKPYVSCWCTLDDVNEANGTVYLIPYDRAGTKTRIEHTIDPVTQDRIGYFGNDPGDPIVAPAGSIAVFSSTVFHRSGPNLSDGIRRIFLPQYSAEPVLNAEGKPVYIAEKFLENGERIRTH